MSSLIPGFEYDIFISYRQKDNKHDGWVTEFVSNLKGELEATFKEDVSVYFDINPHDGLLETHEVSDSLNDKLKCLIFIPIISRTYCDPRSFAWEHEFMAFVDKASGDRFGLKVKLPGGNVASRVLPVRIYDLSNEDLKLCENLLGGPLRGIEFIYKSAGVNRPLRANEDHAQDNLNKTYYRDQINKISHSIHEIILGLKGGPSVASAETLQQVELPIEAINRERRYSGTKPSRSKWIWMAFAVLLTAALITFMLINPKLIKKDKITATSSIQILERAINVCDPLKSWGNYSGKIHMLHEKVSGRIEADEVIEIQPGEDYYKCTTLSPGSGKLIKGIKNGECFYEVNGNTNPDEKTIKEYGLDSLYVSYWKEYHYCHFGLLMELKNSGLTVDDHIRITKFQGKDCYTLSFKNDTVRGKNIYFKTTSFKVYIEPVTFALKGYALEGPFIFNGYVVLSGNLRLNNIILPLCKTYFNNIDSSFMFVDLVTYAQ